MHELVSCELTQVHDVLTAIKGHWRWCRLRLLLVLVLASLYRSNHVLQISLPLLFCRRTLISYDTSIEKRNPIVYASRSSFACPVFVGISSGAIWFWYDYEKSENTLRVLSHVLKQRDSSQLTSASTFWIRKDELLTSDKTLWFQFIFSVISAFPLSNPTAP